MHRTQLKDCRLLISSSIPFSVIALSLLKINILIDIESRERDKLGNGKNTVVNGGSLEIT